MASQGGTVEAPDRFLHAAHLHITQGEAEDEAEYSDLDKVNSSNGIDCIIEALTKGLQIKAIHQKRKLLADFESIVRQQGETMQGFVNRYRKCERAPCTIATPRGQSTHLARDAETGAECYQGISERIPQRWLEPRCYTVIISRGIFELSQRQGQRQLPQERLCSGPGAHAGHTRGAAAAPGHRQRWPSTTLRTMRRHDGNWQPGGGKDECVPDDGNAEDVLTVMAGRKGNHTIAVLLTGKSATGKSMTPAPSPPRRSTSPTRERARTRARTKVFAVARADGDYTHHGLPPHQPGSFFNFMTSAHHVHNTTAPEDFSRHMILGTEPVVELVSLPHEKPFTATDHLRTKSVATTEMFQFGSGNPTQALHRVYMPARLGQADALLGTCVLGRSLCWPPTPCSTSLAWFWTFPE